MSCLCVPFLGTADSLGEPCRLEDPWRRLLPNGEIFTALVLSTLWSEKYKGRNMVAGERAEVRLPQRSGAEPAVWHPTLLHRIGSKEICVFIWAGDEQSTFPTIYLAFSPLRKKMQLWKILSARASLMEDTFQEVQPENGGACTAGAEHTIPMQAYVQSKMKNLWQKYGFQEKLEDTLSRYPDHLVLCCGLSHGATMAQAAVLKLSLMFPKGRFQAVTWNAYKWMSEKSAAQLEEHVGQRLLSFVLSQHGYWDGIAGAPHDLAPVPRIVLLDADTGACRPAKDVRRTHITPFSLFRTYRLHFAKTALRATRLAMTAASRPGLEDRKTISWPSERTVRRWSFWPQDAWSPMNAQEEELAQYERGTFFVDEGLLAGRLASLQRSQT